jgi:hypothetical protein
MASKLPKRDKPCLHLRREAFHAGLRDSAGKSGY